MIKNNRILIITKTLGGKTITVLDKLVDEGTEFIKDMVKILEHHFRCFFFNCLVLISSNEIKESLYNSLSGEVRETIKIVN